MSDVAGAASISAARTTFETLAQNAFMAGRAGGAWQTIARRVDCSGGLTHEELVNVSVPGLREWAGSKDFETSRVLRASTGLKKYHASLELDRATVENDQSGYVAQQLEQFVGQSGYVFDKICFEALASNPLAPDGLSLANSSHLFVGNADNTDAGALSFTTFNLAMEHIRSQKDEHDIPLALGDRVTIVASPLLQREAMEIGQADMRPVAVGTNSSIDSVAGGAGHLPNVYKGMIADVVISPYLDDDDWVVFDSRFQPLSLCVWRDPESIVRDSRDDDDRFKRDVFQYSIEADCAALCVNYANLYGNLA